MGFGARFLAFALLAGFTFFIPFFLLAGAARFAFLDFFTFVVVFRFFAMISLSIGSTKKPRGERAHTVATHVTECRCRCCSPVLLMMVQINVRSDAMTLIRIN